MGIQNLLRFMKPFMKSINIKDYAGKRVGIDAYSWLHKGAYSCSMELCLNSGRNAASRYLQYFMHRINLLRYHKITPVVVFDGGNISCKSATEDERQRKRDANLALAKEKLAQGNSSAAIEFFQRAVCITPSMAHQLIQILRIESVEFIVAPYEADAQLAYLSTLSEEHGGIAAVITEDSDLLAYGCQAIIFKMDRYGNGEEIVLDRVFDSVMEGLSFKHFDKELFTGMCVLAGCDFLPSVPGIGIKRAYSTVSKYRNLDRVLSVLKYEKGKLMPEDYSKSFKEAVAVFHHARIYDAKTKMLKLMRPLPPMLLESLEGDLDFLGLEIPPSMAIAIAQGLVDPITMEAFDCSPGRHLGFDHVDTKVSDHLPGANTQLTSVQQSCFTAFSANATRGENITVIETKPAADDGKYLNEAIALEKLINPPNDYRHLEVIEVEREEFPNNNPFKKRKLNEDNLDSNASVTSDPVSVVMDVDEHNVQYRVIAESQKSIKFPNNNPFKKRKWNQNNLDSNASATCDSVSVVMDADKHDVQRTATPESQEGITFPNNNPSKKKWNGDNLGSNASVTSDPVSVVTDVDQHDVQCTTTPDSQESIKSRPNVKRQKPTRVKNEKLKSVSACKSSESGKTGIFKFFTRLQS